MAKRKKDSVLEGQKPGETAKEASKKDLPSRQDLWFALGLFALAIVLRLTLLNAGLWYTDAVIAAQSAESTYNTGILRYMHGVGYPGHVITIVIFYALFKLIAGIATAESAVFFVSLFFASLTVGLIYLLVKKLSNSTFAALSSALILNVFPVYLSTSTFGMSHQPAGFFIVLAFYLALIASEKQEVKLKVLASASLGWASAIRLESLQMLPLVLLFYWKDNFPISLWAKEGYARFTLRQNKDELIRDILYLILPAILLLALPYTPMLKSSGFKPLWDAFQYNRWLGFWVEGLTPMVIQWVTLSMTTLASPDSSYLIQVAFSLGWVLVFIGLFALFSKKDKKPFFMVFVWCLYFFVLANTLTVEDRHSIPAQIGFTVAMGFGLGWLYKRVHKIAGVLALLALLYLMFTTVYPILEFRHNFCGPKSFAYTLRDTIEENSVVIVMDEGPHLEYYGKINTIGHPLDGDNTKIKQNMDEINGYLGNGTNVYLVSSAFVYDSGQGLSYNPTTGVVYNADSGKVYSNILYSPTSKSIKDTSSGVVVGLYGIWQVELFYNFLVIPVKNVENEDWHKKSVMFGKYEETIFRITQRA
ncbi:MAG: phospholipid carrier-dependent glycosyltransferase [Candidatus Altiarchaeales archaeon]|nr:phospholipid carrier-dependent glycosyltransferase [Candidatus Altiarchaeales archaeon]